jgi:hypothetical protein
VKHVNLAARHDRWLAARDNFQEELFARIEIAEKMQDLGDLSVPALFSDVMRACKLRIVGDVPDGSVDWSELERMLQSMDWTYAMSDSHEIYLRGSNYMDHLMDCMALAYRIAPTWVELMWDNYSPSSFHRPLSSAGMFRTRMTAILDEKKEKSDE